MTLEDFWALIERSSAEPADGEDRADWLTARLAGMSLDDIIDFETHLTAQRRRVDTWEMLGVAACLMEGWCSTDSFFYFQPWLVGFGREAFERVAADPDALADVPAVQYLAGRPTKEWADDEWPEWESLNYVAMSAYERVTGEEGGSTTRWRRAAWTGSATPTPRARPGTTSRPTSEPAAYPGWPRSLIRGPDLDLRGRPWLRWTDDRRDGAAGHR